MGELAAKLLVLGAGVNGSAIAAGLHQAGQDVTVLARGTRFDALSSQGIIIENPFNHRRTVTKVPAIDHLGAETAYDYVLVVVRKSQVADVLPLISLNPSPTIVFMGNNLSGPDEFIRSLGEERVMMGAVYAAGKRDGHVVRAVVAKRVAAPFGEVDGRITPRLKRLVAIFRQAGFGAEASSDIVDFQATHGAEVALIGKLVLKYRCDTRALARAGDDLRLFVDARREAHEVLRALGRRIVPRSETAIGIIPVFVQVAAIRMLLRSKLGEVGLAWHCSQAPDEIRQLEQELKVLVDRAGLAVPAIWKVLAADSRH